MDLILSQISITNGIIGELAGGVDKIMIYITPCHIYIFRKFIINMPHFGMTEHNAGDVLRTICNRTRDGKACK